MAVVGGVSVLVPDKKIQDVPNTTIQSETNCTRYRQRTRPAGGRGQGARLAGDGDRQKGSRPYSLFLPKEGRLREECGTGLAGNRAGWNRRAGIGREKGSAEGR